MAAVDNLLSELDEICKCLICMNELNDPRLLPCLHRFCRDCLDVRLKRNGNALFKCPTCSESMEAPQRAYQLGSDVFTSNMIKCTDVLKKVKTQELPTECGDCTKKGKIIAYCFKCQVFICAECYHRHMNFASLKSHRDSLLCFENLIELTIDYLQAIRIQKNVCYNHNDKLLRLVCKSCNDVPVCGKCASRYHKGHKMEDLVSVANDFYKMLESEKEKLTSIKRKMEDLLRNIENMKMDNGRKKLEKVLESSYQKNISLIEVGKNIITSEVERRCMEIAIQYEDEKANIKCKMEDEIQVIKDKYQTILITKEETKEKKLSDINTRAHEQYQKLERQRELTDLNYQQLVELINTLRIVETEAINKISKDSEQTYIRYDKYLKTSEKILSLRNDWECVQWVSTVCTGMRALQYDLDQVIGSQLEPLLNEQLSLYMVPPVSLMRYETELLEDQCKSVTDIKISDSFGKTISNIAVSTSGNIVISGHGQHRTHITVINDMGEIERIQPFTSSLINPKRYCSPLKDRRIAMVCCPDEIGMCDLSKDLSCSSERLGTVFTGLNSCNIRCVTTDRSLDVIYVGFFDSRTVHVFNNRFKYCRSITLNQCPKWPFDLCVSGSQLLVCDLSGEKAFAVDMTGKFQYVFPKPRSEKGDFRPRSICADQRKLIYILWQMSDWSRAVIAQYSQSDGKLIALRRVTGDASCITTLETSTTKDILLVTETTKKLYVYSLASRIDL